MRSPLVLIAAVVAISGASCTGTSSDDLPGEVTELLWLPTEARLADDGFQPVRIEHGRSIYVDGSASVYFTIDADRDELSTSIVQHLASLKWSQRSHQYLNPQLPTSFEGGWQIHGGGLNIGDDRSATPLEPYRRWRGEWQDTSGNIIVYDIGGQGRQLRGGASYVPRAVVDHNFSRAGWR